VQVDDGEKERELSYVGFKLCVVGVFLVRVCVWGNIISCFECSCLGSIEYVGPDLNYCYLLVCVLALWDLCACLCSGMFVCGLVLMMMLADNSLLIAVDGCWRMYAAESVHVCLCVGKCVRSYFVKLGPFQDATGGVQKGYICRAFWAAKGGPISRFRLRFGLPGAW